MDAVVVVPYRTDHGWRDVLWDYVRLYWSTDYRVVVGHQDEVDTFNHPQAINRAVAATDESVILVVDADTICDLDVAAEMVRLVASGEVAWAATTTYVQLHLNQTKEYLERGTWHGNPLWRGERVSCCGVVVVPREGFDHVGGYDERFRGWGADDGAFRCAMDTLWGPLDRVEGETVHFWHERDEELHRHQGDQHELVRRYQAAAGDPVEMRRVVGSFP